jgi:hypothetical protein
MRLSLDRALFCIQLMVEGDSIRSTERITGVHRDAILALLVKAGERCEKLLADPIIGLRVRDVQADEMWGFVAMKEKAKGRGAAEHGHSRRRIYTRCGMAGLAIPNAWSGYSERTSTTRNW